MALITALDNPTPSASFDSAASVSMENVFFLETSAAFLVFLAPIQTTQAVGVFLGAIQAPVAGSNKHPNRGDLDATIPQRPVRGNKCVGEDASTQSGRIGLYGVEQIESGTTLSRSRIRMNGQDRDHCLISGII